MVNVLLLKFYIASSTTNFNLFFVCTAIQSFFLDGPLYKCFCNNNTFVETMRLSFTLSFVFMY